jgi:hypothetical protein
MEIYESVTWVVLGFVPTLLAMETASRLALRFKSRKGKETPLNLKMVEVEER